MNIKIDEVIDELANWPPKTGNLIIYYFRHNKNNQCDGLKIK